VGKGGTVTLDQYYMLAQIIASVAVVGSLLFLGFEMRRNYKQTRLANWEAVIDRFNALWSRTTTNTDLAEILVRGRQSYGRLSAAEKIVFGDFHQEMILTFETMMLSGAHATVSPQQMAELTERQLSHFFRSAGSREWWREIREELELPRQITAVINAAIGDSGPRSNEAQGETT
jgi:hypothetical protein